MIAVTVTQWRAAIGRAESDLCNFGENKAGDTLSLRHVSSCDVTRAVGMWEAI